jgi:predicted ribosome quality control (RQC) complex YloA/Tae2 family protein
VDLATITAICKELDSELRGRRPGKIFQLSKTDLSVDFRLSDSRYLFISVESRNPRAYLIRRRMRDLEKNSGTPSNFALALRKHLSSAELSSVTQVENERVLLLEFDAVDDLGDTLRYTVATQLTGASANLFLLDSESKIVAALRQTRGAGQQIGEVYEPPARLYKGAKETVLLDQASASTSVSDQLDADDRERSAASDFQRLASSARNKLTQEISKNEKLLGKLNGDLERHGEPDQWKRFGDLLLANTSSARREGGQVFVTDYFDEDAPEIAIAVDENDSLTEAAEKFFKRYTKARNARLEIEERKETIRKDLERLNKKLAELEGAIEAGDEYRIEELTGAPKKAPSKKQIKSDANMSGTRSFTSSDGFEILVGKKAKDNDFLTFRIAKSLDTWMHAADYPGSHVVVRNPNRKEIPHKTLLEAAQLAAFYSQGKSQPKAAVHFTQKKFVNKPKGSAPGLVSLASFKTLLVEPKIGDAKRDEK